MLGRNPFHSDKFSERTIGNSGSFSAYSPALFDFSGRKSTAPLNRHCLACKAWFKGRISAASN